MIFIVSSGNIQSQLVQPVTAELGTNIALNFSKTGCICHAAIQRNHILAIGRIGIQPCHIVGHFVKILCHICKETILNGLGCSAAVIGGCSFNHIRIIAGSNHQGELLRNAEHRNGNQIQMYPGPCLHLFEVGEILRGIIVIAHHERLEHKPVGQGISILGQRQINIGLKVKHTVGYIVAICLTFLSGNDDAVHGRGCFLFCTDFGNLGISLLDRFFLSGIIFVLRNR